MNLFERIDEKRKEKGITKREITKACGINETGYTGWQKDRTESYKKYLPEIAEVLGVSIEYLTTGEEANPIQTAYNAAEDHIQKAIRIMLKIEK